jgi:hypothetical protein
MIEDRDFADRLARLAAAVPVRSGQLDPVHAGAVAARHQLRMRWLSPLVALVILALVGGALGSLTVLNGPISATTRVGDFELTFRSEKARYATGEPVGLSASLTYVGPKPLVRIHHAYMTPLGFGFTEPVNGVQLSPGWRMSCETEELLQGLPLVRGFRKSGGDNGDTPGFLPFMNDPNLVLPAGRWHAYAVAYFGTGECGGGESFELRADLTIEVVDRPTPTARPTPTTAVEVPALHVVNLDASTIEVVFRNEVVASLTCGETTVVTADQIGGEPPWTLSVRTIEGRTLDAVTVDGQLPAGILVRDGMATSGPWPMSYGPVENPCLADSSPESSLSALPTPGPIWHGGPGVAGVEGDETFEVHISTQKGTFAAGEAIEVHVHVLYRGAAATIDMWSSDPAVSYNVEQLDGPHVVGGVVADVCMKTEMYRDAVQDYLFTKATAYSADDPDIEWIESYLAAPDVRLTPGTWRLSAHFQGAVGECGGEIHKLTASIIIKVTSD